MNMEIESEKEFNMEKKARVRSVPMASGPTI